MLPRNCRTHYDELAMFAQIAQVTASTAASDWNFGGWWGLVAGSYVIGMFPTAEIVGYNTGHDPTSEGSGNPGATNMYRLAGWLPGLVSLVGDVLKCVIPVVIALIWADRRVAVACGAVAILGHIFPATRSFKGGKGVACYGGFAIATSPFVALGALAVWLISLKLWRRSSLAAVIAVPTLPIGVALRGREGWEVAIFAALAVIILLKHIPNIIRLVRKEETKL